MKKALFRWAIAVPLAVLLCMAVGCRQEVEGGITEEAARAIGDIYVKARNEANLDLLDDIYSPDIVVHDPGWPQPIVGLEALKSQYRGTHAAVPDVKFSMGDMYVKGDKVAWIFTMSGTMTGPFSTPFGDLSPTGKAFRFSGVAIDRVADGKIVEEWLYFNPLEILLPMGFALTPPQPETE